MQLRLSIGVILTYTIVPKISWAGPFYYEWIGLKKSTFVLYLCQHMGWWYKSHMWQLFFKHAWTLEVLLMTCTFIYVHMATMSACAALSKRWRLIDYSISTKNLMNLPLFLQSFFYWKAYLHAIFEPAHEYLVSVAYAYSCSLNMVGHKPSVARCLNFGMHLYLHPYFNLCMATLSACAASSKH